jgi:hypothetical protein
VTGYLVRLLGEEEGGGGRNLVAPCLPPPSRYSIAENGVSRIEKCRIRLARHSPYRLPTRHPLHWPLCEWPDEWPIQGRHGERL